MSNKVVEGTAVEVKRPLRPEMWGVTWWNGAFWCCDMYDGHKAKRLAKERAKNRSGDIIHIPAEDSE